MLENQQCRHCIEFIDFPRDIGKSGAGVDIAFEFDGEKKIRMVDGIVDTSTFGKVYRLLEILLFNLVSGELEEEIGGFAIRRGMLSLGASVHECQSLRGMPRRYWMSD